MDSEIENEIPVKITNEITLPGVAPIVTLGPNGSGKTRHAVTMAGLNDADIIAALRNIALPPDIAMRPTKQAKEQLQAHLKRRRSQPWEISSEINELFSNLLAENSDAAIKFRDGYLKEDDSAPETTKLMKLSEVWTRLFPGRHIEFNGYHPVVRSDYNVSTGEYPAQQMSDGERVALYLAARVLNSDKKVMIVDEPEVHFHSLLASRFWTELEKLRPDCRFVYVTHDLPFALSRANAEYIIIKPNEAPSVVSFDEGVPHELAQSLLAAATFSIHAKRIVFCEGEEGRSYDQPLYTAWFNSRDIAVVPVGPGKDVVRCATTFSESTLISGLEVIGIIDCDYWPKKYIDELPKEIFVLPVHEVENVFCLKEIVLAVAEHLGNDDKSSSAIYEEFMSEAVTRFKGKVLNKQILERYKRKFVYEVNAMLNQLDVLEDIDAMQTQQASVVGSSDYMKELSGLFSHEKTLMETALSNPDEFIKLFPGKPVISIVAKKLKIEKEAYVDLICNSLTSKEGEVLFNLGKKVETCLNKYLPKRSNLN